MGFQFSTSPDLSAWDAYACSHPQASVYHLSGWLDSIRSAYGHQVYFLAAWRDREESGRDAIRGVFPLVHISHFLFGNSLVSVPFCDIGGILADDTEAEAALLREAVQLAATLQAGAIELRSTAPLAASISPVWRLQTSAHKFRMLLELPESAETLMRSFKSKLRSQIKKPIREALKARIGGIELLDDFYRVFLVNMRDLGSPVHSKRFIRQVLERLSDQARALVVYKGETAVAASIMVGFRDTLWNPWASSLKAYSSLSPNMLLYWSMLEYACSHGYRYFEFGRSTPGEGTFKFKEQWGARPAPLQWHYISKNGFEISDPASANSIMRLAGRVWRGLPVPITQILGPSIRKHISL
jgi:FemAB-related protein (PEP-CTERM system-associated)